LVPLKTYKSRGGLIMKRLVQCWLFVLCTFFISEIFAAGVGAATSAVKPATVNELVSVNLPKREINKAFALDQALQERRSVRDYVVTPLSMQQFSQLLWAADGISDAKEKHRTAPSAWATYPLNLYLVKQDGVWQYDVANHALKNITTGDLRKQLKDVCYGQKQVGGAPASLVITMQYNKISSDMGKENGRRFAILEAGHVAQNFSLEAVSLGLVTVPMTGFKGKEVQELLKIPDGQEVIYIIPVGYAKR
jgi:SagB-type dehydrogenase family enzyme